MIETVVALLMFVNGEIKEHLCKKTWHIAFAENATRKDSLVNLYLINALKVKQK